MPGIRDLLSGSGGTIDPPPEIVWGDYVYSSTSGKRLGRSVVSGHPIAGTWVSVAFSHHIKLQISGGSAVVDTTEPMRGHALHSNSSQNAAILWGTFGDDGRANFDGMSPDWANPSCLLPAASSIPFGGKILGISDGIWNFAPDDGSGGYVDYAYPLVWDGSNNLTAVLLFNPTNTFSLVEYNTFVRCTLDVAAIESWLGQYVCP